MVCSCFPLSDDNFALRAHVSSKPDVLPFRLLQLLQFQDVPRRAAIATAGTAAIPGAATGIACATLGWRPSTALLVNLPFCKNYAFAETWGAGKQIRALKHNVKMHCHKTWHAHVLFGLFSVKQGRC